MSNNKSIYQGCVDLYLQGKGALQPLKYERENPFQYYIGSPTSRITVKDFRNDTIDAAVLKLSGKNGGDFADSFNKTAIAKITEEPQGINIELHPCNEQGDFPTLWLGVIHDRKMPVHKIAWEFLRPISDHETAFAVLVYN